MQTSVEVVGPSCKLVKIGNENSARSRSFSDRSFFEPPLGHGHPRLRVMDVRTKMLAFFPAFRGLDQSFCPRTSAGISAWTSAGHPAPKLTLWADFSFLRRGPCNQWVPSTSDARINNAPSGFHAHYGSRSKKYVSVMECVSNSGDSLYLLQGITCQSSCEFVSVMILILLTA